MTATHSKANYVKLSDVSELISCYVCTDCGVVVASKIAHDRLHSVMSSWAWLLAVLKTSHAAAHLHDQYNVIERIDSKTFEPAVHENVDDDKCERAYASELFHVRQADRKNYGHAEHRCVLQKPNRPQREMAHLCGCNFAWSVDEITEEIRRFCWDEKNEYYSQEQKPGITHPDRYGIAWKLWSWTEELDTPVQRSSDNWLKLGDGGLTKRERTDRDLYLSRADQMIGMAGKRDYVRFLDNGTFRCLEPECEREPEFAVFGDIFIHAQNNHKISAVLIENRENEEHKS